MGQFLLHVTETKFYKIHITTEVTACNSWFTIIKFKFIYILILILASPCFISICFLYTYPFFYIQDCVYSWRVTIFRTTKLLQQDSVCFKLAVHLTDLFSSISSPILITAQLVKTTKFFICHRRVHHILALV